MKKFLSNTIVQLLIAVIIGLLAGFVVNDAVLEVVICIKHITGQIIFFLVPLIILGFISPSIAHLRSNASKMLLFAFGIAYLSSIGASFFGAAVGYNVIPFLHIADDANTLKALPENLLKIDIPPVMNVMTALVLAALIGLATAWVKSDEISKLLDTFQKMVLELVKRVLLPVLPVFIAANFCILSYQGAVTKQLPVFLSVLIVVIVCHFIWLSLLYFIAAVYSRKNSWQVLKYYGPAYLTALGTMSSAATLGVALECARKSPIDTFIRQYTPMRLYPDRNRICTHCIPNALWKYAQYITNYFIHPVIRIIRHRCTGSTGGNSTCLFRANHLCSSL